MSVVSGIVTAEGSKKSADTQRDGIIEAAKIASETQMEMYEMGLETTEPWRTKGAEALDTLANKIAKGPGEFNFEMSEGERFARDEGLKARERSAAARGGLMSGAALKEAERFASGFGAQRYDQGKANFLREYYEGLTPLQSLAGVGQSTASQTAAGGNAVAASIANKQFGAGVDASNAIATGNMNAINAINGSVQATTNNALVGYNAWRNRTPTTSIPNSNLNQIDYGQGGV